MIYEKPSFGFISSTHDMDYDKDGVIESNADIYNASATFDVSMKIRSFTTRAAVYSWSNRSCFLNRRWHKFIKPRSFAMLCEVRTQRHRQTNRTLEFGWRTYNDFLVRFERHHAHADEKFPEFPSHKFNFLNGDVDINYVQLTYNVSCRQKITTEMKLNEFVFLFIVVTYSHCVHK